LDCALVAFTPAVEIVSVCGTVSDCRSLMRGAGCFGKILVTQRVPYRTLYAFIIGAALKRAAG
jgi:hypothetical protein